MVEFLEILDAETQSKMTQSEASRNRFEKVKKYFLHIDDILEFKSNEQELIMKEMQKKKIASQVISQLEKQDQEKVLMTLSDRQQEIMLEEIDLMKGTVTFEEQTNIEFIEIVRSLQKKKRINPTVKHVMIGEV